MSTCIFRLLLAAGLLGAGVSCVIDFTPDDQTPGYVQLDLADAKIVIRGEAGAANVTVVMTIEDGDGADLELMDGQAVRVNGVELVATDDAGRYEATVPESATYVIRVEEPTTGVDETTVNAPAEASLTAPAAGATVSLSGGFNLLWDQADANAEARVVIVQAQPGGTVTKAFGPATDDGEFSLTGADLVGLTYSAPPTDEDKLNVTLTRAREYTTVAGLRSAEVAVEVAETVVLTPGA